MQAASGGTQSTTRLGRVGLGAFRLVGLLRGPRSGRRRAAKRTDRAARTWAAADDPTLQHPRCVFQLLKRHFARYTPEMVEQACGIPRAAFNQVCAAITANSGRDRTTALVLRGRLDAAHRRRAVHPGRVDPPGAARQHRPAGRRHPGAARARVHSGIHRHPDAVRPAARVHPDAARAHATRTSTASSPRRAPTGGFWANCGPTRSACSRPTGAPPRPRTNDYCFDYLPRLTGNHSTYETVMAQLDGDVRGLLPARREPGGRLGQRQAAAARPGQVRLAGRAGLLADRVGDVLEGRPGDRHAVSCARRTSAPRCSSCRPPRTPRRDGSFTNTQRMLQWHHKAVEPAGRRAQRAVVHLPPGPADPRRRRALGRRVFPRDRCEMDRPVLDLTWDYPRGAAGRAVRRGGARRDQRLGRRRQAAARLHEAQGRRLHHLRLLDLLRRVLRRGQPGGAPQARQRAELDRPRVGLGLAGEPAHPVQPRVRRPGRQAVERAQGPVWWDADEGKWTGHDVPDFVPDKAPSYRPPRGRDRAGGARGHRPVHHAGRRQGAGCTRRPGWSTGRCPRTTSRRSRRCATRCTAQQRNPVAGQGVRAPGQPVPAEPTAPPGAEVFPYVVDHLPADRAPHRGRDEPLAAVPGGAAAGVLLRGLARARRRARARPPRLGHHRHRAERGGGAGARHRRGSRR